MRELAQLLECGLCLIHSAVESDGKLAFARCLRCRTGDTEVICEREQPLLRTVVEVPLEKAADAVAGLDDARAGGLQVVEPCEELGLEPLVIDGEARGGADLPCRSSSGTAPRA